MKKLVLACALGAALSQPVLAADDWRFALGLDAWQPQTSGSVARYSPNYRQDYDEDYQWHGFVQIEHGIWLLPNAKLALTDVGSSGGAFENELTALDFTLYYRLFNNDLFQVDAGVTARQFDGDFNLSATEFSYSKDLLLGYTAAQVHLPGTGLGAFGDLQGLDEGNYDIRLGVQYKLPMAPLTVRGGWREFAMDFKRVDQTLEGWFVGAALSF
ncbi:MAG: TIGR04219 family outer membrane beta-barrel protein [Aeromonas sp.]